MRERNSQLVLLVIKFLGFWIKSISAITNLSFFVQDSGKNYSSPHSPCFLYIWNKIFTTHSSLLVEKVIELNLHFLRLSMICFLVLMSKKYPCGHY